MLNNKISTVQNIVDFFVKKSGGKITQLKLQKLLYYVYALNYSDKNDENSHFHNVRLDFQAWVHGPVNGELRRLLRGYSSKNITSEVISKFDSLKNGFFGKEETGILESIWFLFGDYDAKELERISHSEKPWIEKRVNDKGEELSENQKSKNIISTKTMKEYYRLKYDFIWNN